MFHPFQKHGLTDPAAEKAHDPPPPIHRTQWCRAESSVDTNENPPNAEPLRAAPEHRRETRTEGSISAPARKVPMVNIPLNVRLYSHQPFPAASTTQVVKRLLSGKLVSLTSSDPRRWSPSQRGVDGHRTGSNQIVTD